MISLAFMNKTEYKMQETNVKIAKKMNICKKNLVFHREMLYNVKG